MYYCAANGCSSNRKGQKIDVHNKATFVIKNKQSRILFITYHMYTLGWNFCSCYFFIVHHFFIFVGWNLLIFYMFHSEYKRHRTHGPSRWLALTSLSLFALYHKCGSDTYFKFVSFSTATTASCNTTIHSTLYQYLLWKEASFFSSRKWKHKMCLVKTLHWSTVQ